MTFNYQHPTSTSSTFLLEEEISRSLGDRTFDVWTITVINDISFDLRNAFEQWMNGINKHDNATGVINPTQYQKDAVVYQLGRNTKTSTSGFPTTIADATLSAF